MIRKPYNALKNEKIIPRKIDDQQIYYLSSRTKSAFVILDI